MGSTSCPGRFRAGSGGPRCRPAVPDDSDQGPSAHGPTNILGDSGPCPRAHSVDQLSWVTQAHARGPTGLNSGPGGFGPGSEGPRFDQLSRVTQVLVRGLAVSTSCPAELGSWSVGPQV